VEGIALSGVRAQYFDAAGYLQNENDKGEPLIHYRTELHAHFVYEVETPYMGLPLLFERRYTWPAFESIPDPCEEVDRLLRDRGFTLDAHPDRCYHEAGLGRRWWATRIMEGQELTLDVLIQQQERPLESIAPLVLEPARAAVVAAPPAHTVYDITLRGYYRGRWEEALNEVHWLEARLRQRVYLRREGADS
jgi:hypothetical protein